MTMLHATDYARQLDAALDSVGNDLGALDRLNAALDLMPDYDELAYDEPTYEPTQDDWEDYCIYLDRLEAEREYPAEGSPLWTAWLGWLRTPAPVPDGDLEPIPF